MKHLQRYFCVLLCFLLLSIGFSVTASAETDITPNEVKYTRNATVCNSYFCTPIIYEYSSNTPLGEFVSIDTEGNEGVPANQVGFSVTDKFIVENIDSSSKLFKKGESTTVSVYNIYLRVGVNDPRGFFYQDDIYYRKALITYMDGTYEYIETYDKFSTENGMVDITITFIPTADVKSIEYQFFRKHSSITYTSPIQLTIYSGMSSTKTTTLVVQSSEEAGLLKGIIEWLKGIKDGITNLFNSIAELPSKIWSFIENGLKNLFVPDAQYIGNYKTTWDNLLASRFGCLYQSGSMIKDVAISISNSTKQGTVDMPLVSLHSVGIPFEFGGYTVKVVPDGFEGVLNAVKLIISGIATFLFINAMRKRYDEVMGVEQ